MNTTPTSDVVRVENQASAQERAKVKELAQQFEAMLLTQMTRSMRQAVLSDEQHDGFGNQTMTDTFDSELALSLSRGGGMGLADFIVRAFETRQPQSAQSTQSQTFSAVSAVALPSQPSSAVSAVSAVALNPPQGAVTSAYGWRHDPFTGRVRFHSGTDVKLAYGQDVQAAASGRVAFVGKQRGYGLTVVINHGGGIESRYAHLSAAPVGLGDSVDAGQVIARSGNSGRSTGPHLHFEVLKDGQAVEPSSMAILLAEAANH